MEYTVWFKKARLDVPGPCNCLSSPSVDLISSVLALRRSSFGSLLLSKRALRQSEKVLCFPERALCYHEETFYNGMRVLFAGLTRLLADTRAHCLA